MSSQEIPSSLSFHSNGGTYPPHGLITADDHGPYVGVTTWIMMCLMVLAVLARVGTRRTLARDNVIIIAAAAVSVVQSIVVHIAVNHGLGRHRDKLEMSAYITYSKARYASQMLEIVVLCLAKFSLMSVFMELVPSKPTSLTLRLFTVSIVLWALAAVFALAFQCKRPDPWTLEPDRCYNQDIIYYTNGIINVITDLVILALPTVILWNVQMKSRHKVAVSLLFAVRISVCIAAIIQISEMRKYLDSQDRTWLDTNFSIWTQVMLSLSIITACIPMMKPFLERLQFGLVDSSVAWKPQFAWLHLQSGESSKD